MNFADLKQSLVDGLKPAYYIFGEDAYLRDSAQKMIEKKCVITMPELNISFFNDENFDFEKLQTALQSSPFVDEKRVVVLSDVVVNDKQSQKILEILSKTGSSVCFVQKDSQATPKNKEFAKNLSQIDCNGLDEQTIHSLISYKLKKQNISIDFSAIQILVEYCNADMTFIDQEIKKLVAYAGNGGTISQKDVQTLVHKNIEFAVFDLSNKVVEHDAKRAYEILNLMLSSKEDPIYLFGMITNVFRRLFYVSITRATDGEIAKLLGVKEYSIKVARRLSKNYSPKKLKKILDMASTLDFNIKSGKTDDLTALYQFVSNCLLI